MRRFFLILLCVAAVAAGASVVAVAPPVGAQAPRDDPSRGLIYSGLRRAGPESACRGAYEILSRRPPAPDRLGTRCTHGPDPVPADLDLRPGQDPAFRSGLASPGTADGSAVAGSVGCFGTGTDGHRVQLIYAREAGDPDRYTEFEARFRDWAARIDDVVNTSAAKTGGVRHVRFVTDSQCRPVIQRITLSTASVNDFSDTVDELDDRGLDRVDRKYLLWVDTPKTKYCGIAEIYDDLRPDPTPGVNFNNGHPGVKGMVGRVDTRCWGQANLVEVHELVHMLGGVLGVNAPADAPPHATNGSHCTDESDRLCYPDGDPSGVFRPDGSPTSMQFICPASHEALLDCRNDDYFSASPPAGNWLATHWNTANSAWLATGPSSDSTVAGSAWYSDGLNTKSGPAGTEIRVYAVGQFEDLPYQLVTGRSSSSGKPCAVDLVTVNLNTRFANSSGFVSTTVGPINRLPGTYQVCFAQVDPVTGARVVSGAVTFVVV